MKEKVAFLLLFLFSGTGIFAQNSDPVLMKINGVEIKKSEFEYIYNKNNAADAADQKGLDEYVDLFTNFKLKVIEAESQGLDTLSSFKKELAGYRRQLSQPYMEDKDVEDAFAKEVYNRMQENVDISHILVRLPQYYTVKDTLDAYNRILEIRSRVVGSKKNKAEDFNAVAKEVSEDPSAETNSGHLGYITAFSTVYPFETAAYNTPVGQISMPVRTMFGYHIIKVEGRRPNPGEVLTSHIMVGTPREADADTLAKAHAKIDSIYNLVINGTMTFADAAKKYSDDPGTSVNGGELPWFGVGRMIKEFENTAFSLKKGEVSKPFKTAFGYHIMILNDIRPLGSYDEKQNEIKATLPRSDRFADMKNEIANKLKKIYHYTPDAQGLQAMITLGSANEKIDSVFFAKAGTMDGKLFSLEDQNYTQNQFAYYIDKNRASNKLTPSDYLTEKYDQYVNAAVSEYKEQNLEKMYPDFANLMREYHDGILLFEISNREVWDKAAKDTQGLEKYFDNNRNDYNWPKPRFKGFVISCADKNIQQEADKLAKVTPSDSLTKVLTTKFNLNGNTNIKVEKVLVPQGENKAVDCFGFKTADKKDYQAPEKLPYVFVIGKILKTGPESYQDVKGLVTSDYQNYLEEQWLKYLKAKYPVEINEEVLKTVQ
ncbi:MAG: peptidylprolyl isomerase [Candidatus Azobacteroides sp.]|nr:peptidylprolyl isomerase [Candidatus Azobacteroides sp.]